MGVSSGTCRNGNGTATKPRIPPPKIVSQTTIHDLGTDLKQQMGAIL